MSNESYVSSGGVAVSVYDEGLSGTGEGPMGIEIGSALDAALATHYQQRRDKGLGIWRNPDRPNEVVYPFEDGYINVLNESSGYTSTWERKQLENDAYVDHFGFDTAHAYFTAVSKPWHEAKEGEVWVLTRWGTEEPFLVTGGDFITSDLAVEIDLDDDSITAGRRIWPVEVSDD